MSVPLGHKNHKSIRGHGCPRIYTTKPGYVYEVELIDNPILGEVYRLTVVDSSSELRKNSERFIWKSPKWKRNALLTRTLNKVVPKYNEDIDKGISTLIIGNDGHLYTDEGETFYRVHDYEDVVPEVIVPEGVKTIAKEAFRFALVKKVFLPRSLTTILFGSFYGTYTIKEVQLASSDLVFTDEGGFLSHVKVLVPKGTYDYYNKQFNEFICIKLVEY